MAKNTFSPTTRKVGIISMMVVSVIVFILIFWAIIEVFITRSNILNGTDKVFNALDKPFNVIEKAADKTNKSLELTADSLQTIKTLSSNSAVISSQLPQILQQNILPETTSLRESLVNITSYSDQFTADADLLSSLSFLNFAKDNIEAVGQVSQKISDYSKSSQDFLQSIDKLKTSDASSPDFLVNLDRTNKYLKDVQEGTSEFTSGVESLHQKVLDLKKEIHFKVNLYSVLSLILFVWLAFAQVIVFIFSRKKLQEI